MDNQNNLTGDSSDLQLNVRAQMHLLEEVREAME